MSIPQKIVNQSAVHVVKLYDGHTAAVLTDVERVKSFRISGGTKQRFFAILVMSLGTNVFDGKRHWVLVGEGVWNRIGRSQKLLHIKREILLMMRSLWQTR